MTSQTKQPPRAVGLYDPRFEHDACGVGMVARLDNQPTHEVISRSITALENLEHRGASGADACTGDGAGCALGAMPRRSASSPSRRCPTRVAESPVEGGSWTPPRRWF